MKEILIPLNLTTTPSVYDTKQSFSTSDEASGVLTFTTTADVVGTVASLTIRNASENANRQTFRIERLDVNTSPFSYALKNPLPFGQYEGTILLKKNLTVIASAIFLFGVNSSLSAEVLPDLVKAYSLDELLENVETEVSNLKDAFTLTVSETVKGVNKTESSLQAQENVRYLNEHQRKANELERIVNENARMAAELERKDTFDTLVDSEVIEQTVVQEVANEFQQIESTYANRLLSTEQQLADIDSQVDLLNRGLGETFATLVALQTAYPTGDTKDHIVAADGHRYYWNDTAWADGGAYQAVELKNKSVFNPNLSQPLQDYFELYKSYKNVGVSYTGTSDPGNRTWYGLAMLCHAVSVFTKIGIRLTPLNLMGTEYTAELRSGANFNVLLATATGVKQTNGYEFVTFDFGKDFYGDVYVCIKTADGQAPSLDASFLNTSMVTTTDQRYNIKSSGGAWVSLSGGYNAYLKIEFYTDEYATEAQNLLSRVGQVESDISMFQNDFFSPLIQTILGIGDSLTAGAYDLDALTTTIYPNASYLAMINRLKNVAIVNKGSSGSTTNDYRTLHDADIVACNASAVVIWLGVNDVLKGANAFNGTVADVQGADYTLFPNTSAGNLGYIIKQAKARNPNAKIFVCNMLKWFNGGTVVTNLNAANVTIAAVADYLDAYLIDLNTLSGLSYALNRDQCFGINGVHLTEYGYAMIANTVTTVITDVIKNNPTDFRYANMALT